jgi:N-methylhydantoinase A
MVPEETALGAYRVAVASMVRAVRAVSAERGHDPAGMTLVAFGGNGPLHGAAVATALGIPRVLVPPAPGVFSAWGLLAASVAHHASRTHLRPLREIREGPLREVARGLREEALAGLATPERARLTWSADLRYAGQSSELSVPLPVPDGELPGAEGVAALEQAFGAAHQRRYGHQAPGEPVELVHLRLVASLPAPLTPLPSGARTAAGSVEGGGSRRAYFGPPQGWLDVPLVDRKTLGQQAGERGGGGLAGPLIVKDYDATTLVPPGWRASLDGDWSILLEEGQQAGEGEGW